MNTKKDDPNKEEVDLKKKLEEAAEAAEKKDQAEEQEISETDSLQEELEKMTELAKRTMADMQNMKRRQEEEKFHWIKMANADLVKNLLPIIDNLNRAVANMPESADDWHKGVEMSVQQLKKVLEDAGVIEIDCDGKDFDPELCEALAQAPGEKNKVVSVLEKGYMIGDRVIRHAKVQVGNGEKA